MAEYFFENGSQVEALAKIARTLLEKQPELLHHLRSLNYQEREKVLEYLQNQEKLALHNKTLWAKALACAVAGLACLLAFTVLWSRQRATSSDDSEPHPSLSLKGSSLYFAKL